MIQRQYKNYLIQTRTMSPWPSIQNHSLTCSGSKGAVYGEVGVLERRLKGKLKMWHTVQPMVNPDETYFWLACPVPSNKSI
jgi:hypothetical protein